MKTRANVGSKQMGDLRSSERKEGQSLPRRHGVNGKERQSCWHTEAQSSTQGKRNIKPTSVFSVPLCAIFLKPKTYL